MVEFHQLRVTEVQRLADNVAVFVLACDDATPLPAYEPGSHINVEPLTALVRQYSLFGDPADRSTYRIAVKLIADSRGGSKAMHQLAGQWSSGKKPWLQVSAPQNHFRIADGARHHVLLGAGIGITPLLSMSYRLWRQGASFSLDYFPGQVTEGAFSPFLKHAPYADMVACHEGKGRVAVADVVRQRLEADDEQTHYYVCGPAGFMDGAVGLAAERRAGERIHLERFQAAMAPTAPAADRAFRVVLVRDAREFTVPPGRSIADVLEEHGVSCATACRQGLCGTCVTKVLDGVPDHRDSVLTADERNSNEHMCICISRSTTPVLRLDL